MGVRLGWWSTVAADDSSPGVVRYSTHAPARSNPTTAGADGRPLVDNAIEACLASEVETLEVLLVVGDECRIDPTL